MTETYVSLVRRRFEDRHAHIDTHIDRFDDWQLRFTVRLFGDCLDGEKRKELLGGYTEYRDEEELRSFLKTFLPAYTEYALAELEGKKKEGERFDPPWLTQEEYQEMAVREKWPRIGRHPERMAPLQLCREIARTGMLFRPYMLSDPGFNEGVLEFALYYDLLERLASKAPDALREAAAAIAPLVDRAVAAGHGEECEGILREIRSVAARAADIPDDPERLLGPRMERYPREAPPEWSQRQLRKAMETMSLKDLRLSALVHIDLLTAEETREIVAPFVARFPSFYEMPSKHLKDLILRIADRAGERSLTRFVDRYREGRMAMSPAVSAFLWKLTPETEKLRLLREDNARMDQAMMARHLARFLGSPSPDDLVDAGRQIALLTDNNFISNHGSILKNLGGASEEGVRRLYDEVTALALGMMWAPEGERPGRHEAIRRRIAGAAGIPANPPEGGN